MVLISVVAVASLSACSSGSSLYGKRPKSSYLAKSAQTNSGDSQTTWRPTAKNSIPVETNEAVQKWVHAFTGPLRPSFTRWMGRLGQYAPAIEQILAEENAPRDLIYLAMIESGFNMSAVSHAAASGPWQFIPSTGRMYGLNRDFFTDDRHDFVQATRAAARHLNDLYKVYGDWYLCFAAYNAGAGKVNSAIRRGKTSNYWQLSTKKSHLFRQETKDYVPKILAALTVVKNYKKYGFNDANFGDPIQYDRVTVPDATDINVIAQSAGTSVDVIKGLNPSLVKGITPPGESFEVFIPKGAVDEFKRNYAQVPASKRVANIQYQTNNGETLATISKNFNVSSSELVKLNGFDVRQKLKTGTLVQVPASKSSLIAMASVAQSKASTQTVTHKVRKGEDLAKIARNYGVGSDKIAKWNHLKRGTKLKVGQTIKIYQKGTSPGYFATASSGKRYSGISSIIMEEQQNPVTVTDSQPQQIDIPVMVATAPEIENALIDQDQPAIIKTIDGQVIDENFEEETAANTKSKTTTVAKNKSAIKTSVAKTVTVPPRPVVSTSVHEVKANESLGIIARKYGISIEQLKTANGLTGSYVRVGQKLKVQSNATKVAQLPTGANGKTLTHSVKSGETLWSLSKKYGVKVSDIIKWNNLKANQVQANQKLKIVAASGRTSAQL